MTNVNRVYKKKSKKKLTIEKVKHDKDNYIINNNKYINIIICI